MEPDLIRGGAHIGPSENITYGSASAVLAVGDDSLVLSVWPFRYRIEKGRIRSLVAEIDPLGGWHRLRVVHDQQGVPRSIVFIPMEGLGSRLRLLFVSDPAFMDALQRVIERHGFPVERSNLNRQRWPIIVFRAIMFLALGAAAAGALAAAVAAIYILMQFGLRS